MMTISVQFIFSEQTAFDEVYFPLVGITLIFIFLYVLYNVTMFFSVSINDITGSV